jgi:hypothetical protein
LTLPLTTPKSIVRRKNPSKRKPKLKCRWSGLRKSLKRRYPQSKKLE